MLLRRLSVDRLELLTESFDPFVATVEVVDGLRDVMNELAVIDLVGAVDLVHLADDLVDVSVEDHRLFDPTRSVETAVRDGLEVLLEVVQLSDVVLAHTDGNPVSLFDHTNGGRCSRLSSTGGGEGV